jgi:hypothetical protein
MEVGREILIYDETSSVRPQSFEDPTEKEEALVPENKEPLRTSRNDSKLQTSIVRA